MGMPKNLKVDYNQVQNAKNILMNKLTGRGIPDLIGLDKQYETLYNVLDRTVEHGESNSILVLGPRGSGKTSVSYNICAYEHFRY
ncbi:Origin recognition complex subunit 4 [Smittium culicis]|uniref:Origin recognition complex subunit 4 n=1 Tax=Smittium culicis TaxID=133412 RepID=A0A1R1YRB8_9FUNG|nr:Origin recognition complex subunit 4 [Smittium culicis]